MILVPARGVFPFEKVTSEREREVSFPFPSSVTKGSLCFQIVKDILKEFPFQVWKSSQRRGFFLSATMWWGVPFVWEPQLLLHFSRPLQYLRACID